MSPIPAPPASLLQSSASRARNRYQAWTPQRIRDLRYHLGWTQADLAAELAVRQATVSDWETGKFIPVRSLRRLLTDLAYRSGF